MHDTFSAWGGPLPDYTMWCALHFYVNIFILWRYWQIMLRHIVALHDAASWWFRLSWGVTERQSWFCFCVNWGRSQRRVQELVKVAKLYLGSLSLQLWVTNFIHLGVCRRDLKNYMGFSPLTLLKKSKKSFLMVTD